MCVGLPGGLQQPPPALFSLTGRPIYYKRWFAGWQTVAQVVCHHLIKILGNCYAKRSHSSSYGVFVEMRTLMTFGKCSGFCRNSFQTTSIAAAEEEGRKMKSSMLACSRGALLLLLDSNNKSTNSLLGGLLVGLLFNLKAVFEVPK